MAQSENINIIPNNAIIRVHVSQGDIGRTIYFNLYEGSLAYTPTSGDVITCVGTKPSGLGFTVNCTWSGNVVTCVTTEAMTDESGNIETELVITSSDETTVLGTSNFVLVVEKNPHPSNTTDGTQITAQSLQVQIDNLNTRVTTLESDTSGGLTEDIKQALLNCFEHVAWIDEHGQDYYDALEDALYPPVTLASISAVYTQSGTVYDSASLDSLKSNLVVTAHYSDSSTATVTSYTLSGTLTVGTSTITVTYGGKTTTFTVTVTASPTLSSISAVYTQSGTVYTTDDLSTLASDLVVTATYSDSSTTIVSYGDYTLSGTLAVGTSTITVAYGGKTTTFNVTVSIYVTPPLYELSSPTTFDGSTNAIDTDVILQPSSDIDTDWTIVLEYVDTSNASGSIFDFGYASNYSNVRFMYMQYNSARNRWAVYAAGGQSANAWLSASFGETERWVVTHAQGDDTVTAYQKRGTNEAETSVINKTFNYAINIYAQAVPIVIGGTYDSSNAVSTLANGVTINDFRIYDSVWDSTSALDYLENGG